MPRLYYFKGKNSWELRNYFLNSHQINARSQIMYSADVPHDGFSETSLLRAVPEKLQLH